MAEMASASKEGGVVVIGSGTSSTVSPRGKKQLSKVAPTAMFDYPSIVAKSVTASIGGIIGHQMEIKNSPPIATVQDSILSSKGTSNNVNPLASIVTSSSGASGDGGFIENKHVMKINVHSPKLRNLDITQAISSREGVATDSAPGEQTERRNKAIKMEHMEQIRDKLCQSSLNKVFQSENEGKLVPLGKRLNELNEPQPSGGDQQIIVQDWKPVVCKQTQQFLHSDDQRQMSEYKHFIGNALRNKKQAAASVVGAVVHKQANKSRVGQAQNIQAALISSCASEDADERLYRHRVLHINQVQFPGKTVKMRSPTVANASASRAIFREGQADGIKVRDQSLPRPLTKKQLLLNSDSEGVDANMLAEKTQSDPAPQLAPQLAPKSSPNEDSHLAGETTDDKKLSQKGKTKSKLPGKNNFSQMNIDQSVLDVVGQRSASRASEKRGLGNMIKVPNVPAHDASADYLTEGSAGSLIRQPTQKVNQGKLLVDSPEKIMNRTAFIRHKDLSPSLALLARNASASREAGPCDDYGRPIRDKKGLLGNRILFNGSAQGSDKGLSNNEDLKHVVQRDGRKQNHQKTSRSPSVNSSRLAPTSKYNKQTAQSPQAVKQLQKPPPLTLGSHEGQAQAPGSGSIVLTTLRLDNKSIPDSALNVHEVRQSKKILEAPKTLEKSPTKIPTSSPRRPYPEAKDVQIGGMSSIDGSNVTMNALKTVAQLQQQDSPESGLKTKKQLLAQSKQQQKTQEGQKRRTSVVLKSVQVTSQGQAINHKAQTSLYSKPDKHKKDHARFRAKHKALKERLERVIEFKDKSEPCMIVSPAPTLQKNKPRLSPTTVHSQKPMSPISPMSSPSPPMLDLNYSMILSQPKLGTDVATSPLKLVNEQSSTPPIYVLKPSSQLELNSNSQTITEDGVVPLQPEHQAYQNDSVLLDHHQISIVTPSDPKPVKVRLFDIGGIEALQASPGGTALLHQSSQFVTAHQVGCQSTVLSKQSQQASSSIYVDDSKNQTSKKLNDSKGYVSGILGTTGAFEQMKAVRLGPMQTATNLNQQMETDVLVSKVLQGGNSDQGFPQGLPIGYRGKGRDGQVRELNSSSATSRFNKLTDKRAEKIRASDKFARTNYAAFQHASLPEARGNSGMDRASLEGQTTGNAVNFDKSTHSQQEGLVLETQSTDTKYFSKSQNRSLIEEPNNPLVTEKHATHYQSKQTSPLAKHHNIKVVELNHATPLMSPVLFEVPGRSMFQQPEGSTRLLNSQAQVDALRMRPRQDQVEKYMRLTSFINSVFNKKATAANPVKKKNRSQQMKKHTTWNQQMHFGASLPSKTAAAAVQQLPTEEPLEAVKSLLSGQKVSSQRFEPIRGLKLESRRHISSPPQSPSKSLLSQDGGVLSARKVASPKTKKEQPHEGKVSEKPELSQEAVFFQSNSARLHPFYHSLVTQNYDKLAEKILEEEREFIKSAPKLSGLLSESQRSMLFSEAQNSITYNQRDLSLLQNYRSGDVTVNQPSKMSQRRDSTNFHLRSHLSPSSPGAIHYGGGHTFSKSKLAQGTGQSSQTSPMGPGLIGRPAQNQGMTSTLVKDGANQDYSEHVRVEKLGSPGMKNEQLQLGSPALNSVDSNPVSLTASQEPLARVVDLIAGVSGSSVHNTNSAVTQEADLKSVVQAPTLPQRITNLVTSGDDVIALLLDSNQQDSSQLAVIEGGRKLASPLMSKSRQGNSRSLSNVYRQLHASKGQRVWNSLAKRSQASMTRAGTTGEEGLPAERFRAELARLSLTNQGPPTASGESVKRDFNMDLVKEGVSASKWNLGRNANVQPDASGKKVHLPFLKIKGISDDAEGQPDADSPLLDHIFPVLSPTQQQAPILGKLGSNSPQSRGAGGKSRIKQRLNKLNSCRTQTRQSNLSKRYNQASCEGMERP